jgi:peroxiredoxin
LPPYIENLKTIKDKGVDIVAVVAFNDAWVMSAWGKANEVKGDDIVGPPTWEAFPASKLATAESVEPFRGSQ